MSFFSGPLSSSTHGRSSNRGSERNAAQPSRPRWPSPGSAWRSTLEPSGVCGVVEVQRPEAVEPDHGVEVVDHPAQARRRSACRSRRPAGGRSPGRRRAARRRPRARSGSPAPRTSARASRRRRRCPRGAAGRSPTRRAPRRSSPPRAPAPRLDRALERGAGMQHDAVRAQRGARLQRGGQRGQRLAADLGVLGGAVEQVDGVDHQRLAAASPPSRPGTRRSPPRASRPAGATRAGSG